jgi:hypothetical protein
LFVLWREGESVHNGIALFKNGLTDVKNKIESYEKIERERQSEREGQIEVVPIRKLT